MVAGIAGLCGVLAVVHARVVEVERLHYDVHGTRALVRLLVRMDLGAAQRLGRQLERRVDVTRVRIQGDEQQDDQQDDQQQPVRTGG